MIVLGVETSAGTMSAALLVNEKIYSKSFNENNRQAEKLPGLIEAVLSEAGINIEKIDSFACTVGPGSFTGIRSGLSFMQGISLSQGKKLLGLSSLEIMSDSSVKGCVVLNAGKGRYYVQKFDHGNSDGEIEIIEESAFEDLKLNAKIMNMCEDSGEITPPTAHLLCKYIIEKGGRTEGCNLSPLYVRKPQAEIDLQLKK